MPIEIWHDDKLITPDDSIITNTLTATTTKSTYLIKNRTEDTITNLRFDAPDMPHKAHIPQTVIKPGDTGVITVELDGSEMWRIRRQLPPKILNQIRYRLLYVAGGSQS